MILVLGTKGREELYCMVTEIHSGLKYLLVTIVPCVEEVRGQGRRSTFVVLGENTSKMVGGEDLVSGEEE